MTDGKNRFYKARRRAQEILAATGYTVTVLPYGPFDLEAADESGLRKIKICLDAVTKTDRAALAALEAWVAVMQKRAVGVLQAGWGHWDLTRDLRDGVGMPR